MKKNIGKFLAVSMAFAVVSSTAAFAAKTADPAATVTEEKDETQVDSYDTSKDNDENADAAYIHTTGKIIEISPDEKGNKIVTIENEQGGLRFVVAPTTVLVDRQSNAQVAADQLKDGMEVFVVYEENAPMGMSMPPYLGQVAAVVTNTDKGNVSVGLFNDELVNEAEKLQLNIDEKTPIRTTLGTKSILGAEDVKNQTAVVFYDMTTRSIPAQTAPSMVLLIQTQMQTEDVEKEADTESMVDAKEAKAPEMVSLRDAAKEKGYTVVWQGKNQPVLVSKGDVKAEISLGSVSYTVDGKTTLTAQAQAVLKDGKMCVSADVIANLK